VLDEDTDSLVAASADDAALVEAAADVLPAEDAADEAVEEELPQPAIIAAARTLAVNADTTCFFITNFLHSFCS
jgi:hypothetical protein